MWILFQITLPSHSKNNQTVLKYETPSWEDQTNLPLIKSLYCNFFKDSKTGPLFSENTQKQDNKCCIFLTPNPSKVWLQAEERSEIHKGYSWVLLFFVEVPEWIPKVYVFGEPSSYRSTHLHSSLHHMLKSINLKSEEFTLFKLWWTHIVLPMNWQSQRAIAASSSPLLTSISHLLLAGG